MARTPIADVTALGYLIPVFVSLCAILFLGEKFVVRRLVSLGVGVAGVLIILRPGFAEVTTGHIAQLIAAPMFAISYLLAKQLTHNVRPVFIVAALSLSCTLVVTPLALANWVRPSAVEFGWLVLVALLATSGHYALTRAIEAAPLTVTQPFSLLQLVWASLLGMFIFAEPLDFNVILGGVIIFAAAWTLSWQEIIAFYRTSRFPKEIPNKSDNRAESS